MFEKVYHVAIGTLFMLLGIYVVCYSLDFINFNIFFKGWWTLIIIIPAFTKLLFQNNKINSLFWIVSSICLLLYCNGVIKFAVTWKLILASLIIVLGFNLFAYGIKGAKKVKARNRKVPLYFGMFGEAEEKVNTDFNGSNCTALFGGVDLDLTDAKLGKDAHIEAIALFGSVEIIVPSGVNVVASGINILGNSENKLNKEVKKGRKKPTTIYINSTCILGSVEIRQM